MDSRVNGLPGMTPARSACVHHGRLTGPTRGAVFATALLLASCGSAPYRPPPPDVPTAKIVGRLTNAGLFVLANPQCRSVLGQPYMAWERSAVAISIRGEAKDFAVRVPAPGPVRLLVSVYGSGSSFCPVSVMALLTPGGTYRLTAERQYSDGLLAVFVGCAVRVTDESTGAPALTLLAPNGQLPEPC